MPDPSSPLRRIVTSRPVKRVLTHIVVVGLVASAAAFGILNYLPADTQASADALFGKLDIVGRALAGGEQPQVQPESTTYQLLPDPNQPDPLPRDAVMVEPTAMPTPLPTPVAPPSPPPDPPPAPKVVAARPAGTGQLIWPVPGGVISQYYSAGHLALDIAAPAGSTVVAADSGVVTWAGWRNNGGGLVVAIDHGNGISTVYNHLGSIWVSVGQSVAGGQGIAGVGCTGNCTGPHVHFEVIVGGVIVNPLRYL